jgi:hypothetical protein
MGQARSTFRAPLLPGKGFQSQRSVTVMPVTVFPARLPVLGVSPEAEESQYRENDDDCSDPPNDVVHGVLLAAN